VTFQRYTAFEMPVSITTRLVSLFILTFLCLNAGGAVCLVYCQGGNTLAKSKEYCPLSKGAAHCPHAKQDRPARVDQTAVSSNAVSCCTLAINVLAAPLGQKQISGGASAVAKVEKAVSPAFQSFYSASSSLSSKFGPPQIDRRLERLKNCIFRI